MKAVQIRFLIRRDMSEVLEIEQDSFEFAWTEEEFLCCLRQRNFRSQGFVATGVLRGWYDHCGEDAYEMAYRLSDHVPSKWGGRWGQFVE